jgi:hypothetical protein
MPTLLPPGTPRCTPPGLAAGEMDSVSDSASLILQVMVMSGGGQGKSNEFGLSSSLSRRRGPFPGKGKLVSM